MHTAHGDSIDDQDYKKELKEIIGRYNINNLTIINKNGKLLADSREVAEMIEKDHSNLLRDIRGYIDILNNPNSNLNSADSFITDTYTDAKAILHWLISLLKVHIRIVKERFIESKHYFQLTGEELKEFKRIVNDINDPPIKFVSVLTLWIECGELKEFKGVHQNDESLKYVFVLYLWAERGPFDILKY